MKPRSFIHAKQYVIKHTHIVPVNPVFLSFNLQYHFKDILFNITKTTATGSTNPAPWCTNFPNGFSYQPILCQHVHISQCNLYAILQSINCLDIPFSQVELASKFYPFISSTAAASIDHNILLRLSYVHIILVCVCTWQHTTQPLYPIKSHLHFCITLDSKFMTGLIFVSIFHLLLYWPAWCRPIWVNVVDFCDSNWLILRTYSIHQWHTRSVTSFLGYTLIWWVPMVCQIDPRSLILAFCCF